MGARDPHRFVNELDGTAIERLIARLESRAKDAVFTDLFAKYAARLVLPPSARVLDVGCGTGVVLRSLARDPAFDGELHGVDQCPSFVEAARRFADDEHPARQLDIRLGDAHALDFPDDSFDVAIAHTLISHVSDPTLVLGEMARVVRPGGTLVIFDGDYASLSYAYHDHELGHRMDVALAEATFNNPRIMRDLPRMFPRFGLSVNTAWGDAVVEIGHGSYFRSFADTYVPYVKAAGMLPNDTVDAWYATQQRAMDDGTFFAACNYYTYLAQRG